MKQQFILALLGCAGAVSARQELRRAKSGYEWVDQESGSSFKLEKDGNTLKCDKRCFLETSEDECSRCTIYRNWGVKCRSGKVSQSCRQRCCEKIDNSGSSVGNNAGGDDHGLVKDLDPYDGSNWLTTVHSPFGEIVCKKSCINRKRKSCKGCYLEDGDIYCKASKIPSTCVELCCDADGDGGGGSDPDPDFLPVLDYSPSDEDNLTTKHEGDYYLCSKDCMDRKGSGKCYHCKVSSNSDRDVECEEGRVHAGCRKACCNLLAL